MKIKHIIVSVLITAALVLGVTACATSGPQSPPTALDKALFQITTNVVVQTNLVTLTNRVQQIVPVTNLQNQVVLSTNFVTVTNLATVVAPVTNYVYATSPTVTSTVTDVTSMFGPWGTVAGLIATLGLGVFAKFKSQQLNTMTDVAGQAQQAIVTAQNVIKAMPNGAAYAATFNTWLQAHQTDVDLAQEVAQVVNDYVDHPTATTAAAGIVATALSPIIVPGSPTAPTAPKTT